MTRRDKFKKRPVVLKYRAFKDECRIRKLTLPESAYHLVFVLPMPNTWPEKKKVEMDGQPMQQTPDKDNLEKAVLDALFTEDSQIWDGRVTKYWGREPMIIVREIEPPPPLYELLGG